MWITRLFSGDNNWARQGEVKVGSVTIALGLISSVNLLLSRSGSLPTNRVASIVPRNELLSSSCSERATDLFIFVDDLHYLETKEQPIFLDLLHGITRDNPVWLKIAGIRNQCRSFTEHPPTGLQRDHDAAEISLDITLRNQERRAIFSIALCKHI